MVTQNELEQWLAEGIVAAKSGQIEQARWRLLDVVERDQTNEMAWYWLYQVFDRFEDKRTCLENLIVINPHNEWARKELRRYASPAAPQVSTSARASATSKHNALTRPMVVKITSAFWVGISLIFLAGGIIASGEWLSSTIRSRTFPNYLTIIQALELLVAIGFVITGLIGLNIALGLYVRSAVGFYGSLFLALGLLLVGPTASLIINPPSYLTAICIGGMSGMMVLLTLASQTSLKDAQQDHDKSPG
jgi:hypothetical protein